MDRRCIPAMFDVAALAVLWCLAAFSGFQPAMIGIALLLSLEVALFAPVERRALAARHSRALRRSVVEKAWWS